MTLFSRRTLFAALGLFCAHVQASSFSVPQHFEIMFLDKEKVGNTFSSPQEVDLSASAHQVVVRYAQAIDSSQDSRMFRSSPIVINLKLKGTQDVILESDAPRNQRIADKFSDNPQFTLRTKNGSTLDAEHYVLPLKPGLQLNRDYLAEIAQIEGTQVTQASPAPSAPAASASTPRTTEFEMLQFWYEKATPEQQRQFKVWTIDPSISGDKSSRESEMLEFWYEKADEASRKAFQFWLLEQ